MFCWYISVVRRTLRAKVGYGGFHFPYPPAMDNSNIADLQPNSKTMSVRNLGKMVIDSIIVDDMDEREKGKREEIFNRRPQNGEAGNYIS